LPTRVTNGVTASPAVGFAGARIVGNQLRNQQLNQARGFPASAKMARRLGLTALLCSARRCRWGAVRFVRSGMGKLNRVIDVWTA
jgi:hypothetical protein